LELNCNLKSDGDITLKVNIEMLSKLDWRKSLNLKKEVIGLDIGSSSVKLVQLDKNTDGYTVKVASLKEISSIGEENSNTKNANTVKAIQECGNDVAIRNFKFPKLPNDEIESAVLLEADQVCPFDVGRSAVDYQLIPNGDDSVRGVLAVATNELIESKKQLLQNASLENVLMDVDGFALLNCLQESRKGEDISGLAILNMGSSYCNFAMVDEKGMPFIRDIPFAGEEVIEKIAADNGVTKQEVKDSLFNSKTHRSPDSRFVNSLEEASGQLIESINKTLQYYSAEKKTSVLDKVLVCGGFSLAEGFVEMLDNRLTTAAELWNPFEELTYDVDSSIADVLKTKGSALAVATGLAMRAI